MYAHMLFYACFAFVYLGSAIECTADKKQPQYILAAQLNALLIKNSCSMI